MDIGTVVMLLLLCRYTVTLSAILFAVNRTQKKNRRALESLDSFRQCGPGDGW